MAQAFTLPIEPSLEPCEHLRILFGVGLMSFASLLLELALTRLFSVVLFYHFAFLAISVALLGLGAGGVFSYVRREWLARWSTRRLGAFLCAVNAVAIFVVLELVLHLPIALDLNWTNFAKLTVVYLASAVPFFFTGLLFSVVFARETATINRMYGADLLGGAAACLAVVPLLNLIGGPNAILFASAVAAVGAALWAESKRGHQVGFGIAAILIVLIAANYNERLIDVVYAKGMRRDSQQKIEFAKWNAISRVEVTQTGGAKYIVIDADASSAIMNVDPAKWDQALDPPYNLNLIDREEADREESYNWKKDLMSAAPAIANVLRPNGKYAVIGPGGGVDVLRALANGSNDVTGIEINPIIANDIMRGRYAEFSHNLYNRPEVKLHVGDGRSFIRNSTEKYDVIQMTLVDTWASTAAGAFALSENNLYTVEAFQEYFAHLNDDGFIAITRWEFNEPREALRVLVQAREVLRKLGIDDPSKHFVAISDGPLNEDGRPVTVLAKKTPFTPEETQRIVEHLRSNENLYPLVTAVGRGCSSLSTEDCVYYHQRRRGSGTHVFSGLITPQSDIIAQAKLDPDAAIKTYPFNISAVTDDAPFFFFTLKTRDVLKKLVAGTGRGMDWRINLGVTILFMVLAISIVAVLAFLILPLLLYREPRQASSLPGSREPRLDTRNFSRLFFFIAIGLGFILVEIALIQRFVLFLGHPTYALTVVVFLILLSSGGGSLLAKRWLLNTGRVWIVLAVIAACVGIYLLVLPRMLYAQIGLPFFAKLVLSAVWLVPLGFLMGMPFPTGLRALSELNDPRVEWAWALNGSATVLGSVSAMVIAIHFGLTVTLACGAAAYLLAAVFRVR